MKTISKRRATLKSGIAAAALMVWPTVSEAQTQPSDKSVGLTAAAAKDDSDIVVTAQRREETLRTVPAAVQAITGETLERTGTNQFTKLVDSIPGASTVVSNAPGFETIQIRGVSSGAVGDTLVGYYVDDVVFSVPNLQLTPPARLFDLERAEVLRGPQGTLYGAGAAGGLVRLITAKPNVTNTEAKARGEVSFTEGGGTNYNFDAALNVPLVEDRVALRVTGGYEKLSGYADSASNPADRDVNDLESYSIRGRLLFKAADNFDITLSGWRIYNRLNSNNNLQSVNPPLAHLSLGTNPFVRTEANIYSGLIDWDVGFAAVQSATSFIDHTLAYDSIAGLGGGLSVRVDDANFGTKSFTQELRLVSQGSDPFQWVVGGIYNDSTITSDFNVLVVPQAVPTFLIPFARTVDTPLSTRSFAFYGEVSYELFDGKLKPLFGLRYYRDDRSATDRTAISTLPIVTTSIAEVFDAVSPRFNLAFKPNDYGIIYANIARGFRSGTLQTATQVFLAGQAGVATTPSISPDSLWTYELGAKWKLGDTGVSVDVAGYYTDWSNVQVPFATGSLPATVNGADAEIYGIDLGINWRVAKGLTLQAAGNINSSTFSRVLPSLSARLATAQVGTQLPGVPKGNFIVSADYSTQLSNDVSLNLFGSYSYRDRQSDLGSGQFSGNLDQLALRAGLGYKSWRLEVFGDNLTNERGPAVATVNSFQLVYPRRIGLQLSAKY